MQVNCKECNFIFTVGAKCDIDEKLIASGVRDFQQYMNKFGETALTVMLATAMSKADCEVNGGNPITEADIRCLSMAEYEKLDAAVFAALTAGQKRTVEAKPSKKEASTK